MSGSNVASSGEDPKVPEPRANSTWSRPRWVSCPGILVVAVVAGIPAAYADDGLPWPHKKHLAPPLTPPPPSSSPPLPFNSSRMCVPRLSSVGTLSPQSKLQVELCPRVPRTKHHERERRVHYQQLGPEAGRH